MFSHITQNRRRQPWISHEVIVQLIAHAARMTTLKVRAALHRRLDPTGEKVSRSAFKNIQLKRAHFHGDWNYAIQPR